MPRIGLFPGRRIWIPRLGRPVITPRQAKRLIIDVDAVPDTPIEIAHTLGHPPKNVIFTTRDGPVTGFGILVDTSPTSIKVKANVSGVNLRIMLIP